jgi:hypothetical protein
LSPSHNSRRLVSTSGDAPGECEAGTFTELKLLGYDVIRFTWRQLMGQPPQVAATLRTLLDRQHE